MSNNRVRVEISTKYDFRVLWKATLTPPSYQGKVTEFPAINVVGEDFDDVVARTVAEVEAIIVANINSGSAIPAPLEPGILSQMVLSDASRKAIAALYSYRVVWKPADAGEIGDYKASCDEITGAGVRSLNAVDATKGVREAIVNVIARRLARGEAVPPPSRPA